MAVLNRRQLQLLETAYKKRSARVDFNANWRAIYRQLEVGLPDASEKYLCFQTQDFELLRAGVRTQSGLDLMDLSFDMDRKAMARLSSQEKLARITPEADYLLLKFHHPGTLPLAQLPASLPPQTALRLPVSQALEWCQTCSPGAILLVENLDVFDAITEARLPAELGQIWVIYRGSGNHSPAGVKRFLNLQRGRLPVVAFTDLDPAGLQIAHTTPAVSHCLVPQLALLEPRQLLSMVQLNFQADFDKQHRQVQYLQDQAAALGGWQGLAEWICSKRVSIKQQHLLAHGMALVCVPLAH
jgi:hypothetical protein